jgi:ArsR family transcriptional regulator, arsenate/arsenite/antimonite-responsive transcriptional repressor
LAAAASNGGKNAAKSRRRSPNHALVTKHLTEQSAMNTISVISEIPKFTMNAVFQALSDPTRREILRLLRKRGMSAGEIAERFPLAKSTLSGHFNILKNAGLIVAEKNGTTILYSLNASVVEETMAAVMDLFDVGKPSKRGKS